MRVWYSEIPSSFHTIFTRELSTLGAGTALEILSSVLLKPGGIDTFERMASWCDPILESSSHWPVYGTRVVILELVPSMCIATPDLYSGNWFQGCE